MKYHPNEFIGLNIRVLQSNNKNLKGISGKIIDETKNSFKIISEDKKEKMIMKKDSIFMINNQEINGDNIIKRPEERIIRK